MEVVIQLVLMVVLAVVKRELVHTTVTHHQERKLRNLKHLCYQVLGVRNLDLMEAQPEQPGIRVVVVALVEMERTPRVLVALGGQMQFWEQLIFGQVAVVVRVIRALREMAVRVVAVVVVPGNTPWLLLEQVARV
jgi:hypothetical protein